MYGKERSFIVVVIFEVAPIPGFMPEGEAEETSLILVVNVSSPSKCVSL